MQQPQMVGPDASRAYAIEVEISGLHAALQEARSKQLPIRALSWRRFERSATLPWLPEYPQRRPQVPCSNAV